MPASAPLVLAGTLQEHFERHHFERFFVRCLQANRGDDAGEENQVDRSIAAVEPAPSLVRLACQSSRSCTVGDVDYEGHPPPYRRAILIHKRKIEQN